MPASGEESQTIHLTQPGGPDIFVGQYVIGKFQEVQALTAGEDAPAPHFVAVAANSIAGLAEPAEKLAKYAANLDEAARTIRRGQPVPLIFFHPIKLQAGMTGPDSRLLVREPEVPGAPKPKIVEVNCATLVDADMFGGTVDTSSNPDAPYPNQFSSVRPHRVMAGSEPIAPAEMEHHPGNGTMIVGEAAVNNALYALAEKEMGQGGKTLFGDSSAMHLAASLLEQGHLSNLRNSGTVQAAGRHAVSKIIAGQTESLSLWKKQALKRVLYRLPVLRFDSWDEGPIAKEALELIEASDDYLARQAAKNGGSLEKHVKTQTASFLENVLGVNLEPPQLFGM